MDETTLSLHPPLRACWMKRGAQRTIAAAGQQRWHHLFGAYNWRTDEVVWQAAQRKNSESFITFLEHLVQQTDQRIVLVLDNASYHTSYAALAALALFEEASRILPLFLPPYSVELNPIERFWRHLKDTVCANKLYSDMKAKIAAVAACLANQNDPAHSPFAFSK